MKERDALYSKLFWTSLFQNAFRGTPCKEIDCPGLVDFAIGLVNSVLNLPNGQVMCFEEFKLKKSCEINSARQRAFGASWNDIWASNAFFSLPEWQAVKMTFFAPWRNDTLSSRYATKLLAKHTHTHTHTLFNSNSPWDFSVTIYKMQIKEWKKYITVFIWL